MAKRAVSVKSKSGAGQYFTKPNGSLSFISSGSKVLDLALGGGWARRRIANIVGDKSTGKTLLAIEASANFARAEPKGKIRYREVEHAFDEGYAESIGFPLDRVDFGDPIFTVEDLFKDMEAVIKGAKGPELYIVDSLDALSDESELKRGIDETSYGTGKAKKMSELFRKLVAGLDRKDITVLIISQIRDNLQSMYKKYSRSGGHAMDFYATHIVLLQHLKTLYREIKGQKRAIGVQIKAKVEKNKVALAFREAEFPILFQYGVDDAASCLDWLKSANALSKFDLNPTSLSSYRKELAGMSDAEYRKELKQLRQVVEAEWYNIEKSFQPPRRKY